MTQIFNVKDTYTVLDNYLKKRNFYVLDMLLNEYDDRLYVIQGYDRKIKYIRKLFIGPIVGVKIYYVRRQETLNYGNKPVKLIKKIRNKKELKKYYDECYMKFNFHRTEKVEFEREISNIIFKCKKGEERPPHIYV